ncbi:MAG: hypothetical protein GF317_02675 [Candidatus Lokiarchaeota archaeon]|nr:hypothetical protein [Candidatus Lokiarchaeota archaeon]MBD3198811.1 hypothetical protein [Candidatus Lokiarchaeota archaeon]
MVFMKRLTIVFVIIYLLVISYLLLFFFVKPFQDFIIDIRKNVAGITEGSNYLWALLISFVICFLGSASIGFPVPFPFVLFTLSNSVYLRYLGQLLTLNQVLASPNFWFEILGLSILGGLGSALGEFSGYIVGFGAKKFAETKNSDLLKNIDGFGKLILRNKKRTPLYVFLFALTPLPDDILFLPLGLIKYPIWKALIPGWLGKNITTIFYCCWPILIAMGLLATGADTSDFSSVITEAIMLLFTITIMFFIIGFDWNKYLKEREQKKNKDVKKDVKITQK